MKPIKFFKFKNNKLKLFIAIFFSLLMLASILGVLASNNNSSSNLNHETADATNIPTGCSSSVAVGTNYYTNNAVANSATSTLDFPIYGNSSQASSDFSYGMSFSNNQASSSGTLITSYYYDCSVIDPTFSVPGIYYSDDDGGDLITGYSIGTVTVTITTPSGTTSSWSHAFNSNNIGPGIQI